MLKQFFLHLIEAQRKAAVRRVAEMELSRLTDSELKDIGISRGEIKGLVRDM